MKLHPYRVWIILLVLLSVTLACNITSGAGVSDPTPTSTAAEISNQESSSLAATPTRSSNSDPTQTPIAPPTQTSTKSSSASATLTPTQAPVCTTLVNLKIRKGPGTAYDPPLTAVEAGTQLTPFGFNPVGIPGGSWALVTSGDGTLTGWVGASPEFITCNIDLTSLPPVEVAPPPPTATPKPTNTPVIQGSAPKVSNNGGFGDCPTNLTCESSFSPATLVSENARLTSSDKNGEGIEYVIFSIWDSDESVKYYERTEYNPVYCTFGGDGPCNGWTFEDGAFRWTPGGDPVEPGNYVVITIIKGTTPDENGNSEGQMRQFFQIEAP